MRAVVCQNAELTVVDRDGARARARAGRLTVERCGICGSDLHARHGIDELADMARGGRLRRLHALRRAGRVRPRVLRRGRRVRRRMPQGDLPTGTPVVALPLLRRGGAASTRSGCRPQAPGAYAEQVLVEESLMLPVPNGLPPDVAALTEPMAVAWHAVRRGEVGKRRRRDRDRLRAGRPRP